MNANHIWNRIRNQFVRRLYKQAPVFDRIWGQVWQPIWNRVFDRVRGGIAYRTLEKINQ